MFSHSIIAAAAIFLSTANAHMFINKPAPIQGTSPKDPLAGDGSNFPCHGTQFITGKGGMNMAVGSQQPLSFELGATANTAVHGGGSCQVSLTYETDPQKVKDPKNWKVIYSIIGGCPTNSPMNLDGNFRNASDPSKTYTGAYSCADPASNGFDCVNEFSFTVPKEVKNGKATLGFTWFNAVGNREMYMNCADVTITGASDKGSLDSLPSMQVANIAAGGLSSETDCATDQFTYPIFPNPGQYVLTKTASGAAMSYQTKTPYPFTPFKGAGCQKAAAGGQQQAAPTAAPAAAPQSSSGSGSQNGGFIGNSAPSTAKPTKGSNPGGVFAPGAASATTLATAAPQAAQPTAAPAAAAPSAAAPAAAAPPASGSGSSNTSSGSCAAGSSPCPTDGLIVCFASENKWGLCDHGCAVHMLMAAGMACENGAMKAAVRKQVRHPHGLAHRRSLI